MGIELFVVKSSFSEYFRGIIVNDFFELMGRVGCVLVVSIRW